MFSYNRFWHFWFTLNTRHYLRTFLVALATTAVACTIMAVFFPLLWAIPLVTIALITLPTLAIVGALVLLTKLSDFFFYLQNTKLEVLISTTKEALCKEQAEYYLNRRAICPSELLKGKPFNLPTSPIASMLKQTAEAPLMVEEDENLEITNSNVEIENVKINRNVAFKASGQSQTLFVKETTALSALHEVAAREMAELMGFYDVIPANTVTKIPSDAEQMADVNSISTENLVLSRRRIRDYIDNEQKERQTNPQTQIKLNTPRVQDNVARFIANSKMAMFKAQAKREEKKKLAYVQAFIPNAASGLEFYQDLFVEPAMDLSLTQQLSQPSKREKDAKQEKAKTLLKAIDLYSFQENFLVQIILGSADVNPGNTLFTTNADGSKRLHSIDHEVLMPEDNYNVTKEISVDVNDPTLVQKLENVFPIRLWLAGLPQAEKPFSRELMKKVLLTLDTDRLASYHRQKQLFSPKAVGAQLERVELIRTCFKAELAKKEENLTPRALFLLLVNNHPSYIFLKDLGLSDLSLFMLLGQVPEDADMSLIRHPLQFFPMVKALLELMDVQQKLQLGIPIHNSLYQNPYILRATMFATSTMQVLVEQKNEKAITILKESVTPSPF